MTEAEAQANVRPLASGVHVGPSEDSPDTYYTRAQNQWLDCKAMEVLEVGPCRFLPGGVLVVHVQTLFGPETFVIDQEGAEL